jgi:hypothetical protein
MTKIKAAAVAPEAETPLSDAPAQPEEQPREGGSYIRNADGSLTREEEA